MPAKINDCFPGAKFGSLTIIKESTPVYYGKYKNITYKCKCDCGNTVTVRRCYLRSGHTKSCGCLRVLSGKSKKTHGCSKTKLYLVWSSMLSRCRNKNDSDFHNYGGRGIAVCNSWKVFKTFQKWAIENGYKEGLTIERIDNYSNYCPSNCKFADRFEQANNKRNIKRYSYKNQKLTLAEWSRKLGIHRGTLGSRIKYGWSIEDTLTRPVRGPRD